MDGYTHASGYHSCPARNENGPMVAPAVSFQLLSSHNTACTSPRYRKDKEYYVQSYPWLLVSVYLVRERPLSRG